MSKAFGQVTSPLQPAERANARTYRIPYRVGPEAFTDELEYILQERNPDRLAMLYARVLGRWTFLSSRTRLALYGPRTPEEMRELNQLITYIGQMNRAFQQLGIFDRFNDMRQPVSELVEGELAQLKAPQPTTEKAGEADATMPTLTKVEQMRARGYTTGYFVAPGQFANLLGRFQAAGDLERLHTLFARVYARYIYLRDVQGNDRTQEDEREMNGLQAAIAPLMAATKAVGGEAGTARLRAMGKEISAYVRATGVPATQKRSRKKTPKQPPTEPTGPDADDRRDLDGGIAHYRQAITPEGAGHLRDRQSAPVVPRFARAYARLFYLLQKQAQPTGISDEQRNELNRLVTLVGELAAEMFAPPNNIPEARWKRAVRYVQGEVNRLASFKKTARAAAVTLKPTQTPAPAAPRAPAAPPPPEPTTRFARGEVQGSFLLPGGSTLTAEQARLRQLREYVDTLTGEARERANEFLSFYTNIYAPSSSSARWTVIPNQYVYVATMLCPRPDPLGRFLLCDALVDPAGGYDLQLFLAGTALAPSGGVLARGGKGLLLGSGYSNQNLKTINGKQYHRAHTPGGVVVKRVGLGTVLYSAHALVGAVYRGAAGCYSDGGSTSAEVWWREARVRGYAQPSNKFLTKYCAQVAGGRIEEPEESTIVYPKSICADVTALPDAYDRWVDYQTVLKSGLVAFGVVGDDFKFEGSVPFPVKNNHRPFWDTFDVTGKGVSMPGAAIFFEKDGPYTEARSGGIDVLRMELSDETAEMLSRAFHGQSPVLAASIIEALTQSGFDDLAVNYATRADIAPLLAGNATLKRLLESRRLPGVAGLSEARHRRIVKAIGLAGLGQATVDMGEKNPLGFKPLSDKTKRLLAKFKDMD